MSAQPDMWPMAPAGSGAPQRSQLLPQDLRFRLWRRRPADGPGDAEYIGTLQLPDGQRFEIEAAVRSDDQGRRWFEGGVRGVGQRAAPAHQRATTAPQLPFAEDSLP